MTKEDLKALKESMPLGRFEMLLAMNAPTKKEISDLLNVDADLEESVLIKKIDRFLED